MKTSWPVWGSSGLSAVTTADAVVAQQPDIAGPSDGLLGNIRDAVGIGTKAASVEPVVAGSQPHLMVSDPPYGVGYDPSWRARRGVGSGKRAQGKVLNDDRAEWRQAYALFTGDVAYVWHGALGI